MQEDKSGFFFWTINIQPYLHTHENILRPSNCSSNAQCVYEFEKYNDNSYKLILQLDQTYRAHRFI